MQPRVISAASTRQRAIRFAVSLATITGAWLILLPWLARQPVLSDHLQLLDDRKINAGAMFYTELESMEPILERVNNEQRVQR